jgi:hypothetical protein
MFNRQTIWTTTSPAAWAHAPEWMNLHLLLEAERCPKAVVLRRSSYPQVWNRDGYPEKPNPASIFGQIIHASVARIVVNLAKDGCTSLQDPRAMVSLKAMGGYSKIISEVASSILARLSDNPRFIPITDYVTSTVRMRIPQIRQHVQVLISRMVWNGSARLPANAGVNPGQVQTSRRKPLAAGTHFEVKLRDEELKWNGVADMIDFSADECVITDFKSGEESEFHALQIRVYALLWLRDVELNPRATRASKLILSYARGDKVSPGISEIDADVLDNDLRIRSELVRSSFDGDKTKAILSDENCAQCQVRHLCREYWTSERKISRPTKSRDCYFDDLEVVVTARRADRTWEADCKISNILSAPVRVLVRISSEALPLACHLNPGTRLRLIDALVSPGEENIPLVQMAIFTELLVSTS